MMRCPAALTPAGRSHWGREGGGMGGGEGERVPEKEGKGGREERGRQGGIGWQRKETKEGVGFISQDLVPQLFSTTYTVTYTKCSTVCH